MGSLVGLGPGVGRQKCAVPVGVSVHMCSCIFASVCTGNQLGWPGPLRHDGLPLHGTLSLFVCLSLLVLGVGVGPRQRHLGSQGWSCCGPRNKQAVAVMAKFSPDLLLGTPALFRPGFREADPQGKGLGRQAEMIFCSPPQPPGSFVHLSGPCSSGHMLPNKVMEVPTGPD